VVLKGGRLVEQMGPGTQVNRIYRLVRLLGAGGMGEVWEARHERTKGRVAIKLLLPEMGQDREVLRRFQREVEITSDLNHPNIVRVSDADNLPDGRPFLVMEFLEGQDLATYAAGQRLELPRVIEIIEQAAMGLHAAHTRSVIHRDLKPANLFIIPLPGLERPLVKVLDFGISKALDGLSKLTQTRSLMGTPEYMAPEQATGGVSSMDARADQFSLAAIAYELLAGRRAFEGDGMVNVLYKVLNERPPSLASLGATVPRVVEDAVLKGLSKSADGRFGTVLEFSQAVKRGAETVLPGAIFNPSRFEISTPIVQAMPSTPVVTTIGLTTGQIEAVKDSDLYPWTRGLLSRRPGKNVLAFMVASATLVLVAVFLSVAALRTRDPRRESATLSSVDRGAGPQSAPVEASNKAAADKSSPKSVAAFAESLAKQEAEAAAAARTEAAPPPVPVPDASKVAVAARVDPPAPRPVRRSNRVKLTTRARPTAGPAVVHGGRLDDSARRELQPPPGTPSTGAARSTPVQADISRVINNNRLGIQTCYQQALLRDNSLTNGKITVRVTVGLSGRVKGVNLDAAPPFRALEPCIRDVMSRWAFPPSSQEYQTEFPVVLAGNQ
jgi:serine/threonine protein kinase